MLLLREHEYPMWDIFIVRVAIYIFISTYLSEMNYVLSVMPIDREACCNNQGLG